MIADLSFELPEEILTKDEISLLRLLLLLFGFWQARSF